MTLLLKEMWASCTNYEGATSRWYPAPPLPPLLWGSQMHHRQATLCHGADGSPAVDKGHERTTLCEPQKKGGNPPPAGTSRPPVAVCMNNSHSGGCVNYGRLPVTHSHTDRNIEKGRGHSPCKKKNITATVVAVHKYTVGFPVTHDDPKTKKNKGGRMPTRTA